VNEVGNVTDDSKLSRAQTTPFFSNAGACYGSKAAIHLLKIMTCGF
jgi:hypothetical protein